MSPDLPYAYVALRSLRRKARLSSKMVDKAGSGLFGRHDKDLAEESERALAVPGERLADTAPGRGESDG